MLAFSQTNGVKYSHLLLIIIEVTGSEWNPPQNLALTIRIVLDNSKVHTSEETRKYLVSVPGRFEFMFTPKHGSWLNMIEGFFSNMTKQMLRGIRVHYKEELTERIYRYFDEVNEDHVVFHWKYNLDDIDVSEEVLVDTLL